MWRWLLALLLIGAQVALWQEGPLFGIGSLALGAAYFLIFDRAWRTEQKKREQRARWTEDQEHWQQQEARREQEKQRRQQHERGHAGAERWQEWKRREGEEDFRRTGGDASRG